jgi:hypothetical protein
MLGPLLCPAAEFAATAFPAAESVADLPSWASVIPPSEPIALIATQDTVSNAMRRERRNAFIAECE